MNHRGLSMEPYGIPRLITDQLLYNETMFERCLRGHILYKADPDPDSDLQKNRTLDL